MSTRKKGGRLPVIVCVVDSTARAPSRASAPLTCVHYFYVRLDFLQYPSLVIPGHS